MVRSERKLGGHSLAEAANESTSTHSLLTAAALRSALVVGARRSGSAPP